MTDKFHVWFWNRRTDTEKFLMCVIPTDVLFVFALQFTAVPGSGIVVLTVLLTGLTFFILNAAQFFFRELKKYNEEKEREAEMILQTLRGEVPKARSEDEDYMVKRIRSLAGIKRTVP